VRVVCDTNVLVSAFHFGGKPMAVLQQAIDGDIELFFSQPILDEIGRILRDKFGYTPVRLDEFKSILQASGSMVMPTQTLDVVPSDPDENRIVECAVAAKAEAIITGDKDLLRLREFQSIKMVRVRDFLERGQSLATSW
jgi:uncharacterized protein